MLTWARAVKTWHKAIGTVIAYYFRNTQWDQMERISVFEASNRIARIRSESRYGDRRPDGPFFSAIIKYQYGPQMYELVQDTRFDDVLPYEPNEELFIYINPANGNEVKLGDNTTHLWLPFGLFAVGLALGIGLLIWGVEHGWKLH